MNGVTPTSGTGNGGDVASTAVDLERFFTSLSLSAAAGMLNLETGSLASVAVLPRHDLLNLCDHRIKPGRGRRCSDGCERQAPAAPVPLPQRHASRRAAEALALRFAKNCPIGGAAVHSMAAPPSRY